MANPKIQQIPFSRTLLPLQGAMLTESSPFAGKITDITMHWPGGCASLVDVAVGHGNTRLCPREGFLALNDATPTFHFREAVEDNETIWVEMRNGDAINPHTITVTVTVEGAI